MKRLYIVKEGGGCKNDGHGNGGKHGAPRIGTFKAGRISHLASRISHLMRFVMIKFKFRSGSHETGNWMFFPSNLIKTQIRYFVDLFNYSNTILRPLPAIF
jgi:hypothetical protein